MPTRPSIEAIQDQLPGLTYREREILKLVHGIGGGYTYTLEEIGRIFKVSPGRVRCVRDKAHKKVERLTRMKAGFPC